MVLWAIGPCLRHTSFFMVRESMSHIVTFQKKGEFNQLTIHRIYHLLEDDIARVTKKREVSSTSTLLFRHLAGKPNVKLHSKIEFLD